MTKREPVAFDLVELGGGATADDNSAPVLVRRPIPGVPDNRLAGASAAAQSMSRMASPALDQGFRNHRDNGLDKSLYSTLPGLSRPPWVNKHVMAGRLQADGQSDLDNSSMTIAYSSRKKDAAEGPSAWNHSAPPGPSGSHHTMNNSLNRHEDSALAEQARRAAFMHANPLHALRNVARTSLGDEAQLGAHQARTLLGSEPPSSHSAGSGSPVPFYSRMEGNTLQFENGVQSPPRQPQYPIQGSNTAAAHALARPPGTGKHPRTAQLTMFYAGMVNVYDDVPVDKAQAIMLLAGTGNPWSSSNYANFPGGGSSSGRPFSAPGDMSQPMSRAGSPAPQITNPSAGSPLGPVTKLANRQVTTTGLIVELPQARKASLARFLEKRKDRVRKGPYTHTNEEAARNDPASARNSRENSPSHPFASSKPPRRSLSPPAAGNQSNNVSCNATNAARQVQMTSTSGSEPNSPPQTPPRQSMSEDRSHGMLGREECEGATMVARSGKSSPS